MPHTLDSLPVIYMAFANNRDRPISHLVEEERALRKHFLPGNSKCYIVDYRSNISKDDFTTDSIIYANRITLFHFGGHSDSEDLYFGHSAAHKDGVTDFLKLHEDSLKVVFLNGCANHEWVEILRDKLKIPAVIGTSAPIDDRRAMIFADKFYEALTKGKTLKFAFDTAKAHLKGEKDNPWADELRDAGFDNLKKEDTFPWDLYLLPEKAEEMKNWKLPSVEITPLKLILPAVISPPDYCIGRDDLVKELAELLCQENPKPILLLGPGGVGKTNLTRQLMNEESIKNKFQDRRVFVSLEKVDDADLMPEKLFLAMGLTRVAYDESLVKLDQLLNGAPTLLALDNAETTWENDQVAFEELIERWGQLRNVFLIISMRRFEGPFGLVSPKEINLETLDDNASAKLFNIHANFNEKIEANNPLIKKMGGLPIVIVILAKFLKTHGSTELLLEAWEAQHNRLLNGVIDNKLRSIEVCFELSLKKIRNITPPDSWRLLRLIAKLPNGIPEKAIKIFLPNTQLPQVELVSYALAFRDSGRICILKPLSEYIKGKTIYSSEKDDWENVERYYYTMLLKGHEVISTVSLEEFKPELENLEALLLNVSNVEPTWHLAREGFDLVNAYLAIDNKESQVLDFSESYEIEKQIRLADALLRNGEKYLAEKNEEKSNKFLALSKALYENNNQQEGQAKAIENLGYLALLKKQIPQAIKHLSKSHEIYKSLGLLKEQEMVFKCLQGLDSDYYSASCVKF